MLYPIELQAPEKNLFFITTADMSRLRRHIRRLELQKLVIPPNIVNHNGMSGTRLELVTSTMSTWRSNQLS
jgi:hypothetical protein